MKLARILLASAAIALLAACGSDPVGPSGVTERIKPRHSVVSDTTSTTTDVVSGDNASVQEGTGCIDTYVTAGGVTSTVRVCDGRGPAIGSGN